MKKLLINYRGDTSEEELDSILRGCGCVSLSHIHQRINNSAVAILDDSADVDGVIGMLVADDRPDAPIASATGAMPVSWCRTSDDELSQGTTWANQGHEALTRLAEAWDITIGSPDVTVGVVDTGITMNHPDLIANIHPTLGWNFVNDNNDLTDNLVNVNHFGHGTPCSGIIGAVGNNEIQLRGVCWNVKIAPLKVSNDSAGTIYTSDIVDAFDYAILHDIRILNCSFSAPSAVPALQVAMDALEAAGILVVCAAGNDNQDIDTVDQSPTTFSNGNIIVVGACNNDGTKAGFSSFGVATVDVFAPGVLWYALNRANGCGLGFSGTSASAPFVAGIAALILAVDPQATAQRIKELILSNCSPLTTDLPCVSGSYVDAARILQAAANLPFTIQEPPLGFTLLEVVPGREVIYRKTNRDEADLLFDLEVEILWRTATEFSSTTAFDVYNGTVRNVTEKGFRATVSQVNAARAKYATLATGQTGKFDAVETVGGLYSYVGSIETAIPKNDYAASKTELVFVGENIDPESTDVVFKIPRMLPSVIRAVGAGTASVNADYLYAGTIDVGKIVPLWSQSGTLDVGPSVFYLATRFILFGAIPDGYTYPSRLYSLPLSDITAEPPPKGGWEVSTPGYPDVAILGLAPAPYLDYSIDYSLSKLVSFADFKAFAETQLGRFSRYQENANGTISYTLVVEIQNDLYLKDEATEIAIPDGALTAGGTVTAGVKKIQRYGSYMKESWSQIGVGTKELPVFDAYSFNETEGLWSISTKLTGPSGSGEVQLNGDGTYSWALVSEKTVVIDALWKIFGLDYETERNQTKISTSFQQIRRRIGGELEYYSELVDGKLVPSRLPWNALWSWNVGTTYSAAGGHCVYWAGVLYTSKAIASNVAKEPGATSGWASYWLVGGTQPTGWVDAGYAAYLGEWQSFWRKAYIGDEEISNPKAGEQNQPATITKPSVIYPAPANHKGDKFYGVFNAAVPYSADGLSVSIQSGSPYAVTEATASKTPVVYYNGHLYRLKWHGGNTSSYPGYFTAAGTGSWATSKTYAAGDMVVVRWDGATATANTEEIPTTGVRYKVTATNKTYVAIQTHAVAQSFTSTTYWKEVNSLVAKYYTCVAAHTSTEAYEEAMPEIGTNWGAYWVSGVLGVIPGAAVKIGDMTNRSVWESFDAYESYCSGFVGVAGTGVPGAELPDMKIPMMSRITSELQWDIDWQYVPGNTYAANAVVYYLGLLYKSNKITTGLPTVTADWALTTENPTDWVSGGNQTRYGDWKSAWRKSYTGPIQSSSANHKGLSFLGDYNAQTAYAQEIAIVTASGSSGAVTEAVTSKTPVVYHNGHLYRMKWHGGNVSSYFWTAAATGAWSGAAGTSYAVGDMVAVQQTDLSKVKYYTCTAAHAYADGMPGGVPGGTEGWAAYWAEGILGITPSATVKVGAMTGRYVWELFDTYEHLLSASVGLNGAGTVSQPTLAKIAEVDGDMQFALSSSGRVSFYQSPIENPRMCSIYECTKRGVGTLTLYTYFAVNPHWLAAANRRIPTAWADVPAIQLSANSATTDDTDEILPVPFNAGNSNFGIQHQLVRIDDAIYAFKKVVVLRGDWVADEEAAAALASLHGPHSAAQAGSVIAFKDLSGLVSTPWTGTFKDAG